MYYNLIVFADECPLDAVLVQLVSPWQQCAGFYFKQYRREAVQFNQRLGVLVDRWSSITLKCSTLKSGEVWSEEAVSHFRGCLQGCDRQRTNDTSAAPILGLTETTINSEFTKPAALLHSRNFRVDMSK